VPQSQDPSPSSMAFLLIKDHPDATIVEIHADRTTLPTPISGQPWLLPAGSGIA
jgi:hypothetical protein